MRFQYRALDSRGRVKVGLVEAATPVEATEKLSTMRLMVQELGPASGGRMRGHGSGRFRAPISTGRLGRSAPRSSTLSPPPASPAPAPPPPPPPPQVPAPRLRQFASPGPAPVPGRPTGRARVVFFRCLGVMFNAGVPIVGALEMVAAQSEDPVMRKLGESLATRVSAGHSLPSAMAAHRGGFTRMQINLVEIGFQSGCLGAMLTRLADYEEKQEAMLLKLRSAVVYPAFLLAFSLLLVTFVPPYLFGGMFAFLESSGLEIPWMTRIVMGVSAALRSPAFYAGAGLLGWAVWKAAWQVWDRASARLALAEAALPVKGLGYVLRTLATARFARALELLVNVGVPLHKGLPMAAQAALNPVLELRSLEMTQELLDGATLQQSLARVEFFPRLLLHCVRVGEEGGALGEMLRRVADMYDLELEAAFDSLAALAEPVIMLIMGLIVAFTVTATMLPMVKLVQSL